MAETPDTPLKPNAETPQGPGTHETAPTEGAHDGAARAVKLRGADDGPPTEDEKRAEDRKRMTEDETKKRAELLGTTDARAGELEGGEAAREPIQKESPAQTLKAWRAT